MNRRSSDPVVISGFGCLTPIGNSPVEVFDSFLAGRSGIRSISLFDASRLPVRVAGEVRGIDPMAALPVKDRQHVSRAAGLAVTAARQAFQDARLQPEALNLDERRRIAVILGTGGGGLEFTERQYGHYFSDQLRRASVYSISTSTIGGISSEVSLNLGLRGPSHIISTGCTSSTDAIHYAAETIRSGRADVVVTGGVDAPLAPGILAGFCMMRVVTESWNHAPERASRPFSRDRDGFVLSEGAWIYVVEKLSTARARSAPIYAEICGYGSTCDAHHRVRLDESGEEPARAMQLAIADAGASNEDIALVNLHGTSTLLNDRIETGAVKRCFGSQAERVPMNSTKSMVGHPQGASGAAGISSILFTFQSGWIAPTINLEVPDPACDLDYVAGAARRADIGMALANCIGFGSKNSALVLRNPKDW